MLRDAPPLSRKQIASIVTSKYRINAWEGSVRSGKTIASILRWFGYLADPPRGGELVMVGRTRDSLYRNVLKPMMDPALFGSLAKQVRYTNGASTARILGREVHILGANDAQAEPKVRGMTCGGAYCDEVTTLPKAFFDQLVARCSVAGAQIFCTTNPDNPAHWFRKEYLLRPLETRLGSWHFTLDDNPFLDPAYVAALKATYTGLFYKRNILGLWVQAEGAVYDMWDEDRHVIDIVPPITQWLCLAADYGTTNPFHAVLLGIGGENDRHGMRQDCLYGVAEWRWDSRQKNRQLTDVEYSQRLRQWLGTVRFPGTHLRGPTPQYLVIDPSAASFKVQAFQDGWNVIDGDNSVVDGIRLVSSLLSAGRLKFSRSGCPAVIEEFPGYSWSDKDAKKGVDKPVKAGDHGLDATRYGITTTRSLWHNRINLATAA
jgi:PBSX family phage terminase large subunit